MERSLPLFFGGTFPRCDAASFSGAESWLAIGGRCGACVLSQLVGTVTGSLGFGLWSVCFPPALVRTARRLPVEALCESGVLVSLAGYPRGGAPGPGAVPWLLLAQTKKKWLQYKSCCSYRGVP